MTEQKTGYRADGGRAAVLLGPTATEQETPGQETPRQMTPEEYARLEEEWLEVRSLCRDVRDWEWPRADELLAARAVHGHPRATGWCAD